MHGDEKSGTHGFVAEEGEGKNKKKKALCRTDGSHEMTLNWPVKGETHIIKIRIYPDGEKLTEII
ncbi:hypothetical protein [Wolbachia endosymbiont of Wuchereria bancrofti]|uniref:hypothetical protein n=1 Tax=Wolbachia endosymbiont of Wuchereria bancrofti TaxID=96496 RepID=UPI000B4D6466|nr:hypothetical protein [Wolbachia endosymbiont of Wuchereria bancrofti]OWZ24868.1 hypothetical protein CCY16_00822 [Wolbachia endosymbiont of Wuchereria bancrofti]